MRAPAGVPHLRVLVSATAALAVLPRLAQAMAETSDEVNQVIRAGVPRYDPSAYEKAQADLPGDRPGQTPAGQQTGTAKAARAAPKNAPAPLPEPKPATPAPATSVSASEHTLDLPKVTVHPDTNLPKPLPRITASQPLHNEPGEVFESQAARDTRLVKNHLSKFDQLIGRLFGFPPVARAREAEAEKEKARQMNELAAGLEMQAALGRDPEEIKQLRAEYEKLYYSGPK